MDVLLVTGAATDNVDTFHKRAMNPVTKLDNIEAFQTFEDVPPVEQATITAVAAIADPACEGQMDTLLVTGAPTDNVDTMPKRAMDPVTKVDNIEEKDVPPMEQQATRTTVTTIAAGRACEGQMDAFLVTGEVTDNVDTFHKRVMDPVTKVDNIEEKDVPRVHQQDRAAMATIAAASVKESDENVSDVDGFNVDVAAVDENGESVTDVDEKGGNVTDVGEKEANVVNVENMDAENGSNMTAADVVNVDEKTLLANENGANVGPNMDSTVSTRTTSTTSTRPRGACSWPASCSSARACRTTTARPSTRSSSSTTSRATALDVQFCFR